MDFKFNFKISSEFNKSPEVNSFEDDLNCELPSYEKSCVTSAEIICITKKHYQELECYSEDTWQNKNKNLFLKHVRLSDVEKALLKKGERIAESISSHCDLVPKVYEGGLKIWECSIDLIEFLVSLNLEYQNLKILELGCGVALPGIYCLKQGATVHFQDYNSEVIHHVTIPNVILNCPNLEMDMLNKRCCFFAGDWTEGLPLVDEIKLEKEIEKYDLILSSETIYNPENYSSLYKIIKNNLCPRGIVYVAAKCHYFGIGGNTEQFRKFVERDNAMLIETCQTFEEGLRREILQLKFKDLR